MTGKQKGCGTGNTESGVAGTTVKVPRFAKRRKAGTIDRTYSLRVLTNSAERVVVTFAVRLLESDYMINILQPTLKR